MSFLREQYAIGAATFRKHPLTFVAAMLAAAAIAAMGFVQTFKPKLDFSSPQEKAEKSAQQLAAIVQLRAWIDGGIIQKAERNSVWIKRRQWDACSADDKREIIKVSHMCGYDFVRDWSTDKIIGNGCYGNLKIE